MREAVGSYFLTTIFIVFVLLFAGFMCLSIHIIQKNNGLDSNSLAQIQDFMAKVGYRTSGECDVSGFNYEDTGYVGYGVSGSSTTNKAVFCVKEMETRYTSSSHTESQFPPSAYYQIKVFFAVDLPVVRNFFTFGLKGSTKKLYYPVTMEG